MTLSLFDVSIPSYLQTLDAMTGVLAKGLAFCDDNGVDPAELVEARLFHDMQPFRFQVQQVAFHSASAIQAIKTGKLHLPGQRVQHDYAGLQGLIVEAATLLREESAEAINAHQDGDVAFEIPGRPTRVFTALGFLTSFALPNFYFHATTAYDILRSKGVPLGKSDFMGATRLKS
jgi:hypothetical protein